MASRNGSPLVVEKMRFNVFGRSAVNSRTNKTLNGTSLVGWISYTEDEKSCNKKTETIQREDGFIGYTSHGGSERTFSHLGWITDENKDKFMSDCKKAFSKSGDVFWDTVVSMQTFEDAHALGLKSVEDYAAMYKNIMPSFFKKIGLEPSNMIWWINYHDNTDNPHCHVTFMERVKTRTKPNLTPTELTKWKMSVQAEYGLREYFKEKTGVESREYFKLKDQDKFELVDQIKMSKLNFDDIDLESFYKNLPNTGRLQYGSYNMRPFKEQLNHLIDKILNEPEIKPYVEQFFEKCDTLDRMRNEANNTNSSNIRDNETKKLYKEIGNLILDNYKLSDHERQMYEKGLEDKTFLNYLSKNLILFQNEENTLVRFPKQKRAFLMPNSQIENIPDSNDIAFHFNDTDTYHIYSDKMMFDSIKQHETLDSYVESIKENEQTISGKELFMKFAKGFIFTKDEFVEVQFDNDFRKSKIKQKHKVSVRSTNFSKRAFTEVQLKKALRKVVHLHEAEIDRDLQKFLDSSEPNKGYSY